MTTFFSYRIALPALLSLVGLAALTYGAITPGKPMIAASSSPFEDHLTNYTYCQADFPDPLEYRPPSPGAKLLHVQTVIRHGDRSPLTVLPNDNSEWRCDDMYKVMQVQGGNVNGPTIGTYAVRTTIPEDKAYNGTMWTNGTCTLGQLTSKGARQHIELGSRFRSIYVDQLGFLPMRLNATHLKDKVVYTRVTDFQRTEESAASFLTGAWPVRNGRTPDASVLPLEKYPSEIETMYGHPNGDCPRYSAVLDGMRASETYESFLQQQQPLRTRLETILGTANVKKFDRSWVNYMDAIRPRVCHQMPLPCSGSNCITPHDADAISINVNREFSMLRGSLPDAAEFNRLSLGHFLGELRDRMMAATEIGRKAPLFELFSGHDDTVYGLIGSLLADDMRWPPYASNLIFELWQNSVPTSNDPRDKYMVRVFYNGKPLPTRWCDMNACPLSKYLNHIENRIVRNMTEVCHLSA
ncbi:histidine phosphatase superfamily [Thamnocephalis sphaerospora]|uniref:Histidine phosphatase superfamily n=1 Tax=Thamnocephalis sphaerospora TaxID=78915 RepID=A0A4P9XJG8_9FUNG|nr:histidine phosphatase superfamily [Thamnocephalis sphaerospora]|eukprot:RKP05903.1 histidine phosphatase superfamily [Thamnocephalis sphaerospora]